MGAKTWMLVYADGDARQALAARPQLDRAGSLGFAGALFPGERLRLLGDCDLCMTCPPDDEVVVGCFPGVAVVAAREFGIDQPSRLAPRFLTAAGQRTVYLHAMHSVVDWFAFALWSGGRLRRALSLSPDSGILEDVGERMEFEQAFWSGAHPAVDPADDEADYPFPFHPLELGEAALLALFGYCLEGPEDALLFEPETLPLLRLQRRRRWWRRWF